MKRNFSTIKLIGKFEEKGLPVLLISNHSTWWDGFWAMYVNLKVLRRKFHFMMLEGQLKKYWFFNYTGGYSVNKRSRSIVETLRYTVDLLCDKTNMVLMFPQGKIQTIHQQEFIFENGHEWILKKAENKIHILFLANLTDYFSNPKPGIYMHIQEYIGTGNMQEHYNSFYKKCVEMHKQIIA